MWFDHLQTISHNRKRGAARAAETHQKQKAKAQTDNYRDICHESYMEKWIDCEQCKSFHFECVSHVTEPNSYICLFVKIGLWVCFIIEVFKCP